MGEPYQTSRRWISESKQGLRVKSTLDLLSYLNSNVGFKYLLTSHLSQDKLENLFGIIRQSSGCNDHPPVSQFLLTVNLLAFPSPSKGLNCYPEVINSLLSTAYAPKIAGKSFLERLDDLLDNGNVDGAEEILQSIHSENDHEGYSEKKAIGL